MNTEKQTKICSLEGEFNDKLYMIQNNKKTLVYDCSKDKQAVPKLPLFKDLPISHSRKKWHGVVEYLLQGEYDKASEEKLKVEDYERQLRKKREHENIKWNPALFEFKDNDWKFKDSDLPKLTIKEDEKSSWFW